MLQLVVRVCGASVLTLVSVASSLSAQIGSRTEADARVIRAHRIELEETTL